MKMQREGIAFGYEHVKHIAFVPDRNLKFKDLPITARAYIHNLHALIISLAPSLLPPGEIQKRIDAMAGSVEASQQTIDWGFQATSLLIEVVQEERGN